MKKKQDPTSQFIDVFKTFFFLGCTSFGGPIAHLGYFHTTLVKKKSWVSESQFGQLVAMCQFLPGPASSQLGFALGLIRAGWLGAFAAFIAFTLPSAVVMVVFALLLPQFSIGLGASIISGLKIVAFVVVLDAVISMWQKLCINNVHRVIALIAFVIILFTGQAWSQVLVISLGAILGVCLLTGSPAVKANQINISISKNTALLLLSLFCLLLILSFLLSEHTLYESIASAFYRAGSLVFGGGHVILPLIQDAVVAPGWVSEESFLAGYGIAQAIPGPLFTFAAFLGALISTGASPVLGALIALIFIFLPGLLLIAAVLPFWQGISSRQIAMNAVGGINAAVVGLLLAALYNPVFISGIHSWMDGLIALTGFMLLWVAKLSPLVIVICCVLLSVIFGSLL